MGDPVWYAKWRRLEGQEVVFLEWRIHHEVVRDYHFSGGLADHGGALKYEKCSIFFLLHELNYLICICTIFPL